MGPESSLELAGEPATLRLGAALAGGLAPGRVLHLSGELGSGKTTLVRGLLRELGHTGRVKSPSYPLVELYVISSLNLYHFDFYRFKDRSEWLESGFREYFNAQTACIVEWPERAGELLPPADLAIRLEIAGDGRRAWLSAGTPGGAAWLAHSRQRFSSAA
ncbi:MAG: tRNA (adenosine(37)-N6)-threonylcarbamoyltransferase complex ATPase subunit type 1 TsaE [Betaproteobacteria bacterium]|nr:tRNA (adenosine(37)-N6)-threonylcarbamoyltransferase complex ATPase subunit type 1 TsaE [Betaproteobacteria bacterium]